MTQMNNKSNKKFEPNFKRRFSRLAALQILYAYEQSDQSIDQVIDMFIKSYFFEDRMCIFGYLSEDIDEQKAVDVPFMKILVKGVVAQKESLDKKISDTLTDEWKIERLESIILSILRLGVYELFYEDDIPKSVTLAEYMYLAHAYYEEKEPAFINKILDQMEYHSH